MTLFFSRLRFILKGQTLLRILMNEALAREHVQGFVIDVGGGRNPDYTTLIQKSENTHIEPVDGSLSSIDFEKDPLPYATNSVDCVLTCNLLEHVFNHHFILSETHRVLKLKGKIVGFVPFLLAYHPDPHDYFRYTGEALTRLLTETGFENISIHEVGGGSFFVNFNTIMVSIPPIARALLYPFYACIDSFFLSLRPLARKRYPLGYIFSGVKRARNVS